MIEKREYPPFRDVNIIIHGKDMIVHQESLDSEGRSYDLTHDAFACLIVYEEGIVCRMWFCMLSSLGRAVFWIGMYNLHLWVYISQFW